MTRTKTDRYSRERVALAEFKKMLPMLNTYARAVSQRTLKVKVGTFNYTDGSDIFLRPPMELADRSVHDRVYCGQRADDGQLICDACHAREDVMGGLHHEIAHLIHGTYTRYPNSMLLAVLGDDLEDSLGVQARRNFNKAMLQSDPYPWIGAWTYNISPELPAWLLTLEDVRVNLASYSAMGGLQSMQFARYSRVLVQGLQQEDGSYFRHSMTPADVQITMAVLFKCQNHQLRGWLADDVVDTLSDPVIAQLVDDARELRAPIDSARLAFKFVARLRELGYYGEPEPEPEQDQEPVFENDQQDGDDSTDTDPTPDPTPDEDQEDEPGEPDSDDSGGDTDDLGGDDSSGDADTQHPSGTEQGEQEEAEPSQGDGAGESPESGDELDSRAEPGDLDGDAADEGDDAGEGASDDAGADQGDKPGTDEADQDGEKSEQAGDPDPEAPVVPDTDGSADASAGDEGDGKPDEAGTGQGDGAGSDQFGDGEGSEPEHGDTDAGEQGTGDIDGPAQPETDSSGGGAGDGGDAGSEPERQVAPRPTSPLEDRMDQLMQALSAILGHEMHEHEEGHQPGGSDMYGELAAQADNLTKVIACLQYIDNISPVLDAPKVEFEREMPTGTVPTLPVPGVVNKSASRARLLFAANRRVERHRNQKSGRINGATLGRRVPVQDVRLFERKTVPDKRDWETLIMLDRSMSTFGRKNGIIKNAAMGLAEVHHRIGVPFSIWCSSTADASYSDYGPYWAEVKAVKSSWDKAAQARLGGVRPVSGNLDGHTMQFCRKQLERSRATNKLLLYFTDGEMPASNYLEELEILQAEIELMRRLGITVVGVGIGTDSPREHGLDTVQVDSQEDIGLVIDHLVKVLK